MLRIENTKTNPIPALPLLQVNMRNNSKKKNSPFVYDDNDNQPQQRQQ